MRTPLEKWSYIVHGTKGKSNAKPGEDYSDISVETEDKEIGIVIEWKYVEKAAFEEGCQKAMEQMNDRNSLSQLICKRYEYITVVFHIFL